MSEQNGHIGPNNKEERCLIVKISFTDFANSYEWQNLEQADFDFLVENGQMQRFFNAIAKDIYKKKKWTFPKVD